MSTWRTHAALVGKAPWDDEFLRAKDRSGDLRQFDEWLFRNAHALGPCPEDARSYAFLMHLDGGEQSLNGIAGVVRPSCDRAGRPYPLAVAASIALGPDVGAHAEVVPILLESYWNDAVNLVTELGPQYPEVAAAPLDHLTEGFAETSSGALDLYADWSHRTPVAELCALLDRPGAWLVHAWRTVIELARARRPPGAPQVGIRVPLGRGGGSSLCFWLGALRAIAGWRRHVPSFFWSTDELSGEALLFFGSPDDTTLASLWEQSTASSALCDLTVLPPSDAAWTHESDSPWLEGSVWTALEGVAAASAGPA